MSSTVEEITRAVRDNMAAVDAAFASQREAVAHLRAMNADANAAHWLSWARAGYVEGRTSVEQFEQATSDALHGLYVNFDGSPARHPEFDRGI